MKHTLHVFIWLFLLVITTASFSQGYNIKVRISGLHFAKMYLGYYYGNKTFVRDTVKTDVDGLAVFSGKEKLPLGLYVLILPNNNSMEILIGEDQSFEYESNLFDLFKNTKIKNADETQEYFQYQKYLQNQQLLLSNLRQHSNLVKQYPDSVSAINKRIIEVNNNIEEYKQNLVDKYPSAFIGYFMKAMLKLKIPEYTDNPSLDKRKNDSLNWIYSLNYNRQHYFDNIDFSCSGLIRTPIIESKFEVYFDKLLPQNSDTIIKYSDQLINEISTYPEIYQYILSWLYEQFNNIHTLPDELVYLHLVETYYLDNPPFWMERKIIDLLKEHYLKLKKIAFMATLSDIFITNESNRECEGGYKIVMLYDPHCGKCLREISAIDSLAISCSIFVISKDSLNTLPPDIIEKTIDEPNIKYLQYDFLTQDPLFYKVHSLPFYYLLNKENVILYKSYDVSEVINYCLLNLKPK